MIEHSRTPLAPRRFQAGMSAAIAKKAPMTARTDKKGGDANTPRRRRRLPVLVGLALLIVVAGLVGSIKPYTAYRAVKSEQSAIETQVALLEQENAAIQEQIDRLKHDTYLETLARSELNLARPGEDVFIVTGGETMGTDATQAPEASDPGPLEKMLGSLRRLF
jgi:cell division protein FtsB